MIFATWRQGCRYVADAQKVYEEITAIGAAATTKQILDKAEMKTLSFTSALTGTTRKPLKSGGCTRRGISLAAL